MEGLRRVPSWCKRSKGEEDRADPPVRTRLREALSLVTWIFSTAYRQVRGLNWDLCSLLLVLNWVEVFVILVSSPEIQPWCLKHHAPSRRTVRSYGKTSLLSVGSSVCLSVRDPGEVSWRDWKDVGRIKGRTRRTTRGGKLSRNDLQGFPEVPSDMPLFSGVLEFEFRWDRCHLDRMIPGYVERMSRLWDSGPRDNQFYIEELCFLSLELSITSESMCTIVLVF